MVVAFVVHRSCKRKPCTRHKNNMNNNNRATILHDNQNCSSRIPHDLWERASCWLLAAGNMYYDPISATSKQKKFTDLFNFYFLARWWLLDVHDGFCRDFLRVLPLGSVDKKAEKKLMISRRHATNKQTRTTHFRNDQFDAICKVLGLLQKWLYIYFFAAAATRACGKSQFYACHALVLSTDWNC